MQENLVLDMEAVLRVNEGIFNQLTKDYIKDYGVNQSSCKMMEDYIRHNLLTTNNADYIINRLREKAKNKGKAKQRRIKPTEEKAWHH